MDLGECMDFFRKVVAFFAVGLSSLSAYSSQPKVVLEEDFALSSGVCHVEIEQKMRDMLDIKALSISKSAFTKEPHLHLTNQKMGSDPLKASLDSYKIFLLHVKDSDCFISLVDAKNKPLTSKKLQNCNCKKIGVR